MAKRGQLCAYTCTQCGKACEAAPTSVLALLGLCQEHQDARYAKGLADQRKPQPQAVANG